MLHHLKKKSFYRNGAIALLCGIATFETLNNPGHGFKNMFSKTCNVQGNFAVIIDYIANGTALDPKYTKCDWVKRPRSASGDIRKLVVGKKISEQDRDNFCGLYKKSQKLKDIFTSSDQSRLSLICGN